MNSVSLLPSTVLCFSFKYFCTSVPVYKISEVEFSPDYSNCVITLGRVRVIDVDTCSEVECLMEVGSVGSLDIAMNNGRVVVAAMTSQTNFNGSITSKITTFCERVNNSWDRLHLVMDSPPVSIRSSEIRIQCIYTCSIFMNNF